MSGILVQICLLAVISSITGKSLNGQADLSKAEGWRSETLEEDLPAKQSNQQLSDEGAPERRNDRRVKKLTTINETEQHMPTYKYRSGYANQGSFHENHKLRNYHSRPKRFTKSQTVPKQESSNPIDLLMKNIFKKTICLFKHCDENYKLKSCPNICDSPKEKSREKICQFMGCGQEVEPKKGKEESHTQVNPKPYRCTGQRNSLAIMTKESACAEFCSSPANDPTRQTCTAFGCIPEGTNQEMSKPDDPLPKPLGGPHLNETRKRNSKTKKRGCLGSQPCQETECEPGEIVCPHYCDSPPNDLLAKTCIALGCTPQDTEGALPDPKNHTAKPDYWPDSCKFPEGYLMVLMCEKIGCIPESQQGMSKNGTKPESCPEYCKSPKDSSIADLCETMKCQPTSFEREQSSISSERELITESPHPEDPITIKEEGGVTVDPQLQVSESNVDMPIEYTNYPIPGILISPDISNSRTLKKRKTLITS